MDTYSTRGGTTGARTRGTGMVSRTVRVTQRGSGSGNHAGTGSHWDRNGD